MDEKKYKILIVDDEIMVIRSIMRVLDQSRFNFFYTTNPSEVVDILAANPIDIIISDQRMPGLTGLDLLKNARCVSPNSIRILMSGYTDIDIVIAAINEGRIYQYITKPWDNKKLIDTIDKAIALKSEMDERAAILNFKFESLDDWNDIISQVSLNSSNATGKTVNALLKVIQVKDYELYRHSECVAETGVLLAEALGFSLEQKEAIRYAGLLHDIGKISIRDMIMYKAGPLDDDEFEEMKIHPIVGADILREVDNLKHIADIVEQHHERVDGKGYPKSLRRDEILSEALVLCVADNFEALREDRVYKHGMGSQEALKYILTDVGTKFDDTVVKALSDAVNSDVPNCANTKPRLIESVPQ